MTEFHYLDEDDDTPPEPKKKRGRGRPKGSKSMKTNTYGSFTTDKKKKLIELVRKNGGNKAAAAATLGISRSTVEYHQKNDPVFKERLQQAREEAKQEVSEEIRRRGVEGWDEPVFFQGQEVGAIRRYSDNLLMARAKALMPEDYGNKTDVNIQQNVTIEDKAKTRLANLLGIQVDDNTFDVKPIEHNDDEDRPA